MATVTVKEIQEALKAKRPKYVAALTEMAEAGILAPGSALPMPGDESAPAGADHKQALLDAAKACIDDPNLDAGMKIKKIAKILKLHGGDKADGMDDEPDEDEGEEKGEGDMPFEKKKEESRKLKARNALLEARERLRAAADAANVRLPKTVIELAESAGEALTDERAKAIVAEFKAGGHGGQKPRSAAPVTTPTKDVKESRGAVPADAVERAKWYMSGGR